MRLTADCLDAARLGGVFLGSDGGTPAGGRERGEAALEAGGSELLPPNALAPAAPPRRLDANFHPAA